MLAANGADIIVAGITGVCGVLGAALGLYGVVYAARNQKRPRVVKTQNTELHREREARIRAEVERDVWRQIALDAKPDLPD